MNGGLALLRHSILHDNCHTHCRCAHSPGRLGMVGHQYRQCQGLLPRLLLPPGRPCPPPYLLPHLSVIFRGAGFLFTRTTLQLLCGCDHVCVHRTCVCECVQAEWWSEVSQHSCSTAPHRGQLLSLAAAAALVFSAAAFLASSPVWRPRDEAAGIPGEQRSLKGSRHTHGGVWLWKLRGQPYLTLLVHLVVRIGEQGCKTIISQRVGHIRSSLGRGV